MIHREYSNPFVTRLIITKDELYTENANKPKMVGYININDFTPYPKNPIIAKFFSEIGLADELGSGIKKIAKYVKIYSGGVPIFKEGDIFISKIPILQVTAQVTAQEELTSKYEKIILDYCRIARTSKEIQDYIGIIHREHFRKSILNPLIKKGVIA